MKTLLFIISAALVTLVACNATSENKHQPTNLHYVDNLDPGTYTPTLFKFHDDKDKVTCYATWVGNAGGISCLRDESK